VEISKKAVEAMVDFFLYENIAFRLADSPKLLAWLDLYKKGGSQLATRKQMVWIGHERAEAVRVQVVARLQEAMGVTIGLDGWTNVNGLKVINVVILAGGVAYYWDSLVLKAHARAVDQIEVVSNAIDEIIGRAIRVTAIVTDNEPVNGALYTLLLQRFRFLLHIPCAAHTIQLCVKDALLLPYISDTNDALTALLWAFKSSKVLKVKLAQQQGVLHPLRVPYKIMYPNDTRWNSRLQASERLLLLSDCIIPLLTDVKKHLATTKSKKKKERYTQYSFCEATFWTPLRTLVTFLAPYRDATNIVQSDASNLNDVHQQFSRLMRYADALVFPHPYAPLRSPLLKIIKVEWETHVNKNVVIMCAHLSLNPSYKRFSDKEKDDAQQWFYGWGGDYIKEYSLSDRQGEESISVAIMRQYGAFSCRSDLFAKFDQRHQLFEKDHYNIQAEKDQKSTRYDVRLTWTSFTNTAPELSLLAIALLSITASEAAVERTFSRQGLLHSKLRNRLSDDTVRMQMFFSFNTRALEQPDRYHGLSCKELEVEELDKGTALLTEWQAESPSATLRRRRRRRRRKSRKKSWRTRRRRRRGSKK
jgi:hypothetical protein